MRIATDPPLIAEEGVPQYSVVQFFADDSHEYVGRNLLAKEAMQLAGQCCRSVGAQLGTTKRVILTDAGDDTVFAWEFGKGVVWPPMMAGALRSC